MNQRDLVRMSAEEIDAFLQEPITATVCTLNRDNTIHAVAMFYGFHDGAFAVHTKRKSQKAVNLTRNPTMTVLVEAGRHYAELRGVQLVGSAELIAGDDAVLALSDGMRLRYRPDDPPPETEDERRAHLRNRVLVRLHVERTVSWDHRKLAVVQNGVS